MKINEPCKNSRHTLIYNLNNLSMECKDCFLKVSKISLEAKVGNPFREAERDWYIKELES